MNIQNAISIVIMTTARSERLSIVNVGQKNVSVLLTLFSVWAEQDQIPQDEADDIVRFSLQLDKSHE